jgi:hypothetical protein
MKKSNLLMLSSVLSISVIITNPASAQTEEAPPKQYSQDQNGYDLATGKITHFVPEGGIGSLRRTVARYGKGSYWKDNFDVRMLRQNQPGDQIKIFLGAVSKEFEPTATGGWRQGTADVIVNSGGNFILYQENGDTIFFDGSLDVDGDPTQVNIPATYLRRANGEYIRFFYKIVGSTRTLISVTSSLGWQIKYQGGEVVFINNAVDYCNPTADTCSGLSTIWPKFTYSTVNDVESVYDELNRLTVYDSVTGTIVTPEGVTTIYGGSGITKAGGTWIYSRTGQNANTGDIPPPRIYTVVRTDPLGNKITAKTPPGELVVRTYTNELGKVSTLTFDTLEQLSEVVHPEGNKSWWTYIAGEAIGGTNVSKPLTGAVQITAGYGGYFDACAGPVICMRPAWKKDGKGNQTDFTYDPSHGGILTTKAPVDQNGVRAETRYTYMIIYPLVKNVTGILVNSDPVYMLTKVSQCQTQTICANTADELVTTYSYSTYNLMKTTETVTSGDGSLSQTSTYGYDSYGRVVWIDGPRTDVDDRIYKTYDLAGQLIFEIGSDPDGPSSGGPCTSGCLRRPMVKHSYNLDGQERLTEYGYGYSTDGSDFGVTSFERMTFNSHGQLVKKEIGVP